MIGVCTGEDGRIWYWERLYVPENDALHLRIIHEHHNTTLPGHPELAKSCDLLDRNYYSKEMSQDAGLYGQNGYSCEHSRSLQRWISRVLQPLPVPDKPCEDILMYFFVCQPECEGFDVIWVVVDRLSKMQQFVHCQTTVDAPGLVELILWVVVQRRGLTKTIVSDWGP